MREIKFRAWHDEDNAMYKFQTTGDRAGQFLWLEVPRGKNGNRRPTTRHYKDWSCVEFDSHFHVMQFTGLLDKNDKEIYEGDLATDINDEQYEVRFSEGAFEVIHDGNVLEPLSEVASDIEVLGNIYENENLINK